MGEQTTINHLSTRVVPGMVSVSERIMIVDDELGALTLIGIMLERGGFEVLKARDAYEALAILKTELPDLIILDVMMPGMDGIELCRKIRSLPTTESTPVLILSARGDPVTVQEGLDAGANDYLSKPILHHDLITKIRTMLGIEQIG